MTDERVVMIAADLDLVAAVRKLAVEKPTRKLRQPDHIDAGTPLMLRTAAQIAFPDGSMSAGALRREAAAGHLTIYRMAGKDYTTIADIEEMKTKCRVPAKLPASGCDPAGPTEAPSTSSSTEERKLALDAARATLQEPNAPSKATSSKSTTRPKPSATVIPIKSK
jgi:hypothetical protein